MHGFGYRAAWAMLVWALVWASAPAALAQSSPPNPLADTTGDDADDASENAPEDSDRRARALYQEGDRLYAQGKYELAVEAFQESYRLSNKPLILIALANAYERLGRYEDALRSLRIYAPLAQEADLRERMRSLAIRVEEQRAETETAARAAEQSQLAAAGGPSQPAREVQRPLIGWILTGAGAVSLGASLTLGILAQDAAAELDEQCREVSGGTFCLPEAEPLLERNQTLSLIADIGTAASVAAITTGVLVLVLGKRENLPVEHLAISVRPGVWEVGIAGHF